MDHCSISPQFEEPAIEKKKKRKKSKFKKMILVHNGLFLFDIFNVKKENKIISGKSRHLPIGNVLRLVFRSLT